MDALLFALALEVILLQMRILEGTTELRARPKKGASKSVKAQRNKLDRDRESVKDIIRRTLVEIVQGGEWRTLFDAVRVLHQEAVYPVGLRLHHEELRTSRATVVSELKTEQSTWALELYSADQKIAVLRDKIKNDLQNANARLCYVDKWLFARAEAHQLRLDSNPRPPLTRPDHEQRVHDELVRAFELHIKELEESFEYWRQRYLNDTAKMDERLTAKREQLRVTVARREELQKLYDLHEGEMRSWLAFKSARAARLAREARHNAAANRLQAWWRGVMVRRALGAFKFLKNLKKSPGKSKKK